MNKNYKQILVTGGNGGIGKSTAKLLAQQGHALILLGRNENKLTKAVAEIQKQLPEAKLEMVSCDLMDPGSIKAAGKKIRAEYPNLDVLVNNAGAVFGSRQLTPAGLERTFALNHMGYFLLTHELLPILKKGDQSRIVNVSSGAHHMLKELDWENLQAEKKFNEMQAYALSKLANILFTKKLAGDLNEDQITVNCLHPGVVRTTVAKQGSLLMKMMFAVYYPFMVSQDKGAATSVHLATDPSVADISGAYFINKIEKRPNAIARDEENIQKMWDISMELGGINTYGEPE